MQKLLTGGPMGPRTWLMILGPAFILAGLAALLSGCGLAQNAMKHLDSSLSGLHRKVTLYNANGGIIKSWVVRSKFEDNGGTCYFLSGGKAVTIAGTFIIEEQ